MRIVVAHAIQLSGNAAINVRSWHWYSHFMSPGVLVDPYLDFLDSDSRATTSWERFCDMLLNGRAVRVQGQTPEAEQARLQQEAADVFSISGKLGLLG